jgi:hypothetical protein
VDDLDKRAIYHITHIRNLASIIGAGCLWSDAQRIQQQLACVNIGHKHIKERRLTRPVPVAAKGFLGDYVPFNFCNRSVMLYPIHCGHADYRDGQRSVIHLVSTIRAVIRSGRPWAFTDRHAELRYAQYYDNAEHLDRIDWQVMPLIMWGGNNEIKEKRQAEFLVHDCCPWSCIERIGVQDHEVAAAVSKILESSKQRVAVAVEPGWYY